MLKNTIKKNDGFEGQKAVIVPRNILAKTCTSNDVINSLCVNSIGYYPKAQFHYRRRANGTNEHILIYCTEGRGTIKINKKLYKIEPNDFFIIPKRTEHVYGTVENNPWTIYWVHFTGHHADSIVSSLISKLNNFKEFIHYSERRKELF